MTGDRLHNLRSTEGPSVLLVMVPPTRRSDLRCRSGVPTLTRFLFILVRTREVSQSGPVYFYDIETTLVDTVIVVVGFVVLIWYLRRFEQTRTVHI